ncbi:MAG: response regulator transcription factor [Clostridia bacterium]|nr:response regulator transcription factor [Clostridia bacterium]
MITVLLADDEPLICDELKFLLSQERDVRILEQCFSGNEALEKISSLKPDLVFLDIKMPGLSGLEVAKIVNGFQQRPFLVFVTAYKDYALEGYKVNAIDYLLKPFDETEIKNILEKVRKLIKEKENHHEIKNHFPTKICVEKNGKLEVLDPQEIIMVYSKDRLVYIKTLDNTYLTNLTLQELEEQLKDHNFFRCHRKYIVNLDKIKQIIPWFNGTYLLLLKDKEKTEISVSRTYVKELKEIFKDLFLSSSSK